MCYGKNHRHLIDFRFKYFYHLIFLTLKLDQKCILVNNNAKIFVGIGSDSILGRVKEFIRQRLSPRKNLCNGMDNTHQTVPELIFLVINSLSK